MNQNLGPLLAVLQGVLIFHTISIKALVGTYKLSVRQSQIVEVLKVVVKG
jgi:hypothetical protein